MAPNLIELLDEHKTEERPSIIEREVLSMNEREVEWPLAELVPYVKIIYSSRSAQTYDRME